MEFNIEKTEEGYKCIKKKVILDEENWSEEQFQDNFSKVKGKIRELEDQILPLQAELDELKVAEEIFLEFVESEEEVEEEPLENTEDNVEE